MQLAVEMIPGNQGIPLICKNLLYNSSNINSSWMHGVYIIMLPL